MVYLKTLDGGFIKESNCIEYFAEVVFSPFKKAEDKDEIFLYASLSNGKTERIVKINSKEIGNNVIIRLLKILKEVKDGIVTFDSTTNEQVTIEVKSLNEYE